MFGALSAIGCAWCIYEARHDGYSWAVAIVSTILIFTSCFLLGTIAGKVWSWVQGGAK